MPVVPNQILLVALSSLRPRLWWRLAFVFIIAGGVGAFAAASAVQSIGADLVKLLDVSLESGKMADLLSAVRTHGLWALAAVALLPMTPRTAVLACAIAGLSPIEIGLAVTAGRVLPVCLLSGIGAVAPQLLRRLSSVDRVMREVDAAGMTS